jgi:hypothetical protein
MPFVNFREKNSLLFLRFSPEFQSSNIFAVTEHTRNKIFLERYLRLADFFFLTFKSRVGESPTPRLAESGRRFSITNISANSKPKSERLERYCKGSMRNLFLQKPRKSASLPCPFKVQYMVWILIICVLYSTVHIDVRAKFFFARTVLKIFIYM